MFAISERSNISAVPCYFYITPSIVTYKCDSKDIIVLNNSNISSRTVNIHPKSFLCELQPVSIEEPPSPLIKNNSKDYDNNTRNHLDVDIETENLTPRVFLQAQSLLREHDIFSTSDTDVGFSSWLLVFGDLSPREGPGG